MSVHDPLPDSSQRPSKQRRAVTRTCVGCRAEDPTAHLVRLIVAPDGEVAVDLAGSHFGRGAWLHARPECVAKAAPRGLARSFHSEIKITAEALTLMLRNAADARITGLLASGARGRHLALGSTPVKEALDRDGACLLLVATDARAAASAPWVERVVAQGGALAWGTKDGIGTATGRAEVAVLAVLDRGLADAVKTAVAISQMPMLRTERGTSRVTEVG